MKVTIREIKPCLTVRSERTSFIKEVQLLYFKVKVKIKLGVQVQLFHS
jgi:hypothetical protein